MKILKVLFCLLAYNSMFIVNAQLNLNEKYGEFDSDVLTHIFFRTHNDIDLSAFELIDSLSVRPPHYTNDYCTFAGNVELHKIISKKIGANLIYVMEVVYPKNNLASTKLCYEFKVNYYRNLNKEIIENLNMEYNVEVQEDSLYNVTIYRPELKFLHAQKLDLKINDSVVCKIKNGSICKLKLTAGTHTIKGKREKEGSVVLKIEDGKSYFIRAGLIGGALGPRPDLTIIDHKFATFEMNSKQKN